jgi:hypothetical protein
LPRPPLLALRRAADSRLKDRRSRASPQGRLANEGHRLVVWRDLAVSALLENGDAGPGENFPETDIEPELELRLLLMKLVRQLDEHRALPVEVCSTTLATQEERELASKLGFGGPQTEAVDKWLCGFKKEGGATAVPRPPKGAKLLPHRSQAHITASLRPCA